MFKKHLLLITLLPSLSVAAPDTTPNKTPSKTPNAAPLSVEQVVESIKAATKGMETHCSPITDSHAKLTHCFGKQSHIAEKNLSEIQQTVGVATLRRNRELMTAIETKKALRRKLIRNLQRPTNQAALMKKHWPDNMTDAQITNNPMCSALKTAYINIEACRPLKNVMKEACVRDIMLPIMTAAETTGGKPPAKYRERFKTLCQAEQFSQRMRQVLFGGPAK